MKFETLSKGDYQNGYSRSIEDKIKKHLPLEYQKKLHFEAIHYDILQPNQNKLFSKMAQFVRWDGLHKFVLYGLSDAVGFERNSHLKDSPYEQAQQKIYDGLKRVLDNTSATTPILLIAHSLGAHIISNYIWDAQAQNPTQGIWRDNPPLHTPKDDFLRLKTLKQLYTTGCNIPVFVAGFASSKIIPIKNNENGYLFDWDNYYDKDDILGMPLKPINTAYENTVNDHAINAYGSIFSLLFASWNPMSHGYYWKSKPFLSPLVERIKSLVTL